MGLLLKTDRMEPDFGMEFCQTFGDRLFVAWGEAGDGESSFILLCCRAEGLLVFDRKREREAVENCAWP